MDKLLFKPSMNEEFFFARQCLGQRKEIHIDICKIILSVLILFAGVILYSFSVTWMSENSQEKVTLIGVLILLASVIIAFALLITAFVLFAQVSNLIDDVYIKKHFESSLIYPLLESVKVNSCELSTKILKATEDYNIKDDDIEFGEYLLVDDPDFAFSLFYDLSTSYKNFIEETFPSDYFIYNFKPFSGIIDVCLLGKRHLLFLFRIELSDCLGKEIKEILLEKCEN